MSTKAEAILEEIQGLPPAELHELCLRVNRLAAQTEKAASSAVRVSDEDFATALDEVTGCTLGSKSLERLLDDRRQEREHDEAWLEARKRERARG